MPQNTDRHYLIIIFFLCHDWENTFFQSIGEIRFYLHILIEQKTFCFARERLFLIVFFFLEQFAATAQLL